MKCRSIAAVLALLFALPTVGHAFSESTKADAWEDCGAFALYHLLRLDGRPADVDRLRAVLGASRPAGRSFRELRQAARGFGLSLDAVVLPKRRSAISGPTLAFLKYGPQGHFVVVRPVGHTGMLTQILDGERSPVVWDTDQLLASPAWTGLALVPHRTNYPALFGAAVALCCIVTLGVRYSVSGKQIIRYGKGLLTRFLLAVKVIGITTP